MFYIRKTNNEENYKNQEVIFKTIKPDITQCFFFKLTLNLVCHGWMN